MVLILSFRLFGFFQGLRSISKIRTNLKKSMGLLWELNDDNDKNNKAYTDK